MADPANLEPGVQGIPGPRSVGIDGAPGGAKRQASFKAASPPALNLPKSGGALRGLGEKFQAGGPTGTGSLRVPLPISACRNGTEPSLSLDYDSGQGQGPFGLGWIITLPNIARRTVKGIPRYAYADESVIIILSGQEDLVPALTAQGSGYVHLSAKDGDFRVDAYLPHVEGLFARIERRTHKVTDETRLCQRVLMFHEIAEQLGAQRGSSRPWSSDMTRARR